MSIFRLIKEIDMSQYNKNQWKEWWDNIRELNDTRRNRALTHRCKECGRGSLQGIKTNFPEGEIEAICIECEYYVYKK